MGPVEQAIWIGLRWFANALSLIGLVSLIGLTALAVFQSIENLINEEEK